MDQMKTRPWWVITLVTIAAFVLIDQTNGPIYRALAEGQEGTPRLLLFFGVIYGSTIFGSMIVAAALFGPGRTFEALGLNRNPLPGLLFALLVSSVMLIAIAATSELAPFEGMPLRLLRGAFFPGVGEEIFYRALLFGFLFRFAGWGFLPAALLGAVIFGAAHLYQGGSTEESLQVFFITAFGGLWFAWLYAEWDFNVWVPAAFHVLMNGYWELFEVSETAVGPQAANLSRLALIILSVAATIVLAKRRGGLIIRGRAWLYGGPAAPKAPTKG